MGNINHGMSLTMNFELNHAAIPHPGTVLLNCNLYSEQAGETKFYKSIDTMKSTKNLKEKCYGKSYIAIP